MFKNLRVSLDKRTPEILLGFGIAGMAGAIIFAVKATPKAVQIIEAKEKEAGKKLKWHEKALVAGPCYIPAAVSFIGSATCLIFSSKVQSKRMAAFATAYSLAEESLREYKAKTLEVLGEKKEQEIQDLVAKDSVDRNPVTKTDVIVTGNGKVLCYDKQFGRYFYSTKNKIENAVLDVNNQLLYHESCSLNDFYSLLDMESVKGGSDLGWCMRNGYLRLSYTSCLADDDTPCLVFTYNIAPIYDFDKLH